MIAELTHSLARPATGRGCLFPKTSRRPQEPDAVFMHPNQLIDVTRHCQAHAIPIMSKLPDMQASVFIESIGDLRNIIDFLRMLNLQTARKGPGGSLSIPALHTSEGK